MFGKKEFSIVRNLRFISRRTFMLSWVEHETSFITSQPDLLSLHVFMNSNVICNISHQFVTMAYVLASKTLLNWTSTWVNTPSDICFQWRFRSLCTSAQSDQSLPCSHQEAMHSWLYQMCLVKTDQIAQQLWLIWIFAGHTYLNAHFLTLWHNLCSPCGFTSVSQNL